MLSGVQIEIGGFATFEYIKGTGAATMLCLLAQHSMARRRMNYFSHYFRGPGNFREGRGDFPDVQRRRQ
jgi:hypothetical protein